MLEPTQPPLRVLFVCTGLGIIHRGIESFFREAFDGLNNVSGLTLRLAKGAGGANLNERPIWNLPRTSKLSRCLGFLSGRDAYVIEQWSSLFSVIRQIQSFRPDIVFYSDANLGFLLFWLRRWIGVPYALLFSNGGPVHPPFIRTDCVHQVAPCYYQEALQHGEPASKHYFVPYGIKAVPKPEVKSSEARRSLRQDLGLPRDAKVVLSVGWVRRLHKRMDYVVHELARLPRPRPFLQLLGAIDPDSAEIIALGTHLLGPDGFAARSVSYDRVFDYYRAADCFVLASLREGFGRVYLEALMHGLPVIAHRNAVTDYVTGTEGILGNLRRPGQLAQLLEIELQKSFDLSLARRRWAWVRDRFSWPVLAPAYLKMFQACALRNRQPAGMPPARREPSPRTRVSSSADP